MKIPEDQDGMGQFRNCPFCGAPSAKRSCHRLDMSYIPKYRAYFGCTVCTASTSGEGDTMEGAYSEAIKAWMQVAPAPSRETEYQAFMSEVMEKLSQFKNKCLAESQRDATANMTIRALKEAFLAGIHILLYDVQDHLTDK